MESKTNYTLVGITVVVLLFGLIFTALWLSEGFNRKTYQYYTVYMQESVTGLNEASLVKYNGVKVGTVDNIALNKNNPQQVQLTLKIEEGTPITPCTEAMLIPQGITGTTILGLSAACNTSTALKAKPGEPYPVITYKSSFLNQIEKTVTELSKAMKAFMSDENAKNFNATLKQMPKLTEELRQSVNYFGQMSHDVSIAGKQLGITMQSGKDAIDMMSQQALPPAVSLLHRLDVIAANIEQVSAELRRNPGVLIRGTTPPKKGPGE